MKDVNIKEIPLLEEVNKLSLSDTRSIAYLESIHEVRFDSSEKKRLKSWGEQGAYIDLMNNYLVVTIESQLDEFDGWLVKKDIAVHISKRVEESLKKLPIKSLKFPLTISITSE